MITSCASTALMEVLHRQVEIRVLSLKLTQLEKWP